jgi:hypothetical protein
VAKPKGHVSHPKSPDIDLGRLLLSCYRLKPLPSYLLSAKSRLHHSDSTWRSSIADRSSLGVADRSGRLE